MFKIEESERLKALPPYLFAEIDRMKAEVRNKGVDIIDLGVGDPDKPTPGHIIERLYKAAQDPANHQYPSYSGMNGFRESVARWYDRKYGVKLDPIGQVVTLIGSKEGIAHIPLAFINQGDIALVPEPAYPVYHIGTMFAGGSSHFMPLLEKNGFLPDLDAIPVDIARQAKLMYINYPNNPTGATADLDFYKKVVEFADKYEIIVINDTAYAELTFDDYRAPSLLEVPGGMDVGIEINSMSKTYNMTGWRLAWAAGRSEVVQALGRVKSNIDSGVFNAIQYAGIEALDSDQACLEEMKAMYTERRDVLVEGLKSAGLPVEPPKATFFMWVRVPEGTTSADFTTRLLSEAGIVVTPGNGLGPSGEGYVRFSLTKEVDRLKEAVDRLKGLKF